MKKKPRNDDLDREIFLRLLSGNPHGTQSQAVPSAQPLQENPVPMPEPAPVPESVSLPEPERVPDEPRSATAIAGDREREAPKSKPVKSHRKIIGELVRMVIVLAALAVIIFDVALPVFQVYGSNMAPTLQDGNYVLALRQKTYKAGDVIVFNYNSKLLVKRIIAVGGDVVDIAQDGTVSVNGAALEEPYVTGKSFGQSDVTYPYTVPEDHLFVLGDDRKDSIDSRVAMMGSIGLEQISGKVALRLWPFQTFK